MVHVAKSLYDTVGPKAFNDVAVWLRDVSSEHALEVGDKVSSPSVAWLAEVVTFYDPKLNINSHEGNDDA